MAGRFPRLRRGAKAHNISRRLAPALLVVVVVGASFLVIATTLNTSPAQPARPIVIASGSWEPYVGQDLADEGPVARVVVEALRSEGYSPTVSFSSWPLALDRTQRGEVFGTFPFVESEDRREQYYLSDPILPPFDYVLFYSKRQRSSPPEVETAADLQNLQVGLIDGYDVWPELDEAVDEFVPFDSRLDAFEALEKGDIDLLPESLLSGQALIAGPDLRSGSADFGWLRGEGEDDRLVRAKESLHFMMPRTPEARELMPRFNSALDAIKQTDLFTQAVDELNQGDGGQEVELVPADDTGVIELTDEDDGSTVLAPQGTEAKVLKWPDSFTEGGADAPESPSAVRVKILNGPSAGRVVDVGARSIRLSTPSQ